MRHAEACQVEFDSLLITLSAPDRPPFPIDAMVEEEDTDRLLGDYHEVREPWQGYRRLVAEMAWDRPAAPGSVRVREGDPVRLLAIVHDLAQTPSWREAWVVAALQAVLRETRRRGLRRLALPLLGTRHGDLEPLRCVELLRGVLEDASPGHLTGLWLVVPQGSERRLADALKPP